MSSKKPNPPKPKDKPKAEQQRKQGAGQKAGQRVVKQRAVVDISEVAQFGEEEDGSMSFTFDIDDEWRSQFAAQVQAQEDKNKKPDK